MQDGTFLCRKVVIDACYVLILYQPDYLAAGKEAGADDAGFVAKLGDFDFGVFAYEIERVFLYGASQWQ